MEEQMRSNALRIGFAAVLAAVVFPAAASAQKPLAIEVRGGANYSMLDLSDGIGLLTFPNGEPAAAAEDWGWSASADVFWRFARRGSVYIGWNRTKFHCKEEFCGSDGRIWSAGPEMGFKYWLLPDRSFNPWFRVGLLAHKAKYQEGPAPEENSVRTPGFELGLGTDLAFGDYFAVVPALRFYRYNAGWDIGTPGARRLKKNVGWFQGDVGFQLRLGSDR
jgi:hypothetical protein